MLRASVRFIALLVAAFWLVVPQAIAQSSWPAPPDGWWENVNVGSSASYSIDMAGMSMSMTQTVTAVEGTMLTVETVMNMMGSAMPGSSTTIDAETLDPETGLSNLSSVAGGGASPAEMQANMEALFEIEGEEPCPVGDLTLTCTIYAAETAGGTIRTWHSIAIPPVFGGGAVKAEMSGQGVSYTVTMTGFTGSLMDN